MLTGAQVEIKSAEGKKETGVVTDTTTGEYIAIVNIKKKEDIIAVSYTHLTLPTNREV